MTNNFSFILRRFSRQKLNTFLHVIGLTLGISTCLLIGLFIRYEMSFDSYHKKADRIYRVNQVWVEFGKKEFHYSTPFPLADQIRKDITDLENVTKVHHPWNAIVEITPEKRFKEDRVMMTDPEFLDVFDVEVIKGKGHETLRTPYQALLTESLAKKYYGTENPVGKVFKYKDQFDITVGGVIKDFPGNMHLPASLLLSFSNDEKYVGTSFTHYGSVSGGSTFIVLKEGTKPTKALTAGLQGIYDRTVNKEPWMQKDSRSELELQPLSDIHFNSKYAGGGNWVQAINNKWLWFFGSVGLAVLLLACINFINLSTAQALTRAKEVGVRKSIGAGKFQLIVQFLQEALMLVSVAAVLGVVIVKLALPYINNLAEKQITFHLLNSIGLMGALLLGILITALLAGLYPAWLITKFQPANTLKPGAVSKGPQSTLLRKGLVVTQFSISVCLLIALLIIGQQMDYFRNRNLGFDKDNVVLVSIPDKKQQQVFMNEISRIPQIKDVALSTSPPSGEGHWGTLMSTKGQDDPERKGVSLLIADENYSKLYGFKLKAGRFATFSDTNAVSESVPAGKRFAKVVVNEKLVRELKYASNEAAIGQKFWIGMNEWTADIVGVVEDFNLSSLHEAIKPMLITQFDPFYDKANIKIRAGANVPETMALLTNAWKKAFPKGVFEYSFLDQRIEAQYKTESRLFDLFKIFSALAMLISCLGLWGLVAFAAEQRVKEIGIRKVLGASVPNLVGLLTKDFIILVAIAIVIASPLAYWGMHSWLKEFAFRIDIGWMVFAVSAAAALLIAVLTVSVQAIRAAISNPVKSLRSE
ncbi:MAG TPA: ABC transporter permease [Cyclobacteriaceae bacterium]